MNALKLNGLKEKLFRAKLCATTAMIIGMSDAASLVAYAKAANGNASDSGNSGGGSVGGGNATIETVNVDLDGLSGLSLNAIAGYIVGIAITISQLTGIVLLVWGIYGYVTSRKDGDVESITSSATKLIAGFILIGMKGVLQAIGVIK